jgi:ABC-2 type transport system permease protein
MTLLQKNLGKHYKWWYQYKTSFKSSTAYRWSNLSWLLGRVFVLGFTILLWKINIDAGSNLFTFNQIFTYYIIGSIFFLDNGVHYGVSEWIKNGKNSIRMLYPSNTLFMYFVGDIGWHAFSQGLEVLIYIIVAIFGLQFLLIPAGVNIFYFAMLVIISYIMKVYFYYILGFMAFFITDIWGIIDSQGQIVGFLSSKMLPLTSTAFLLPLTYLPFAFFYHHPMQVYFGNYSWNQSFMTILTGLFWILILHIAAMKLWKVGLKRYEAVGL